MTLATSPQPEGARLPRGRRYAIRALLVTGTLLAVLSIFAVFANRQALNADNWADTSSALLDNKEIRTQVAGFLVDQVYSNVDVKAQVESALPPRLDPLAGPAANALRELAERRANRMLGRPRIQQAWKTANRVTAQQFINIAQGNSGAITSSGNAVVLDLRVVLTDLIQRLGLPRALADKIPPSAGKIKIMSGDQITTIQSGSSTLRGLAVVLPTLVLILFVLAVYLARGRRRHTLMIVGIDMISAGLLVLIGRNVLGGHIVDTLATTDTVRPATEATWAIGTRMLHDVAQALIIAGIPVIVAAWLAGPQRPAVAFRRTTAPWLRESPGLTYSVLGALILLVIAWGPIPATRMPIPVLVMIVLSIVGVQALRRQAAVEFPDATTEGSRAYVSSGAGRAWRTVTARSHNGGHDAGARPSKVEQYERLAVLHDSGALNDEEFAAEKAAIANGHAVA